MSWAQAALTALTASPVDPNVQEVAMLLFKTQAQINTARDNIRQVIQYLPTENGTPAQRAGMRQLGSVGVYCNADQWALQNKGPDYYHKHSGMFIDADMYGDVRKCTDQTWSYPWPWASTYSTGDEDRAQVQGDVTMLCAQYVKRVEKHPMLLEDEINTLKDPARANAWYKTIAKVGQAKKLIDFTGFFDTPIDKLGSYLDHTLLHEFFHGFQGGSVDDIGRLYYAYGWQNAVSRVPDNDRWKNTDNLAYFVWQLG
ncbi:hypothetical protein BT63DRAFT_256837 [Microthyrium microscopicum]|uniref:Lysine-specific metallo-endopeptidase domain-containing protein n=1 Tax=Microthyrium microscopicum TaxID=703497 RepID=A0A6A6UD44_9PEZI|nr:hypothetical protein BT63DRAFT_256837 [Microthyrium microscopicum]